MRTQNLSSMGFGVLLAVLAGCGNGKAARDEAIVAAPPTPNPAGNLDQCANGPLDAPVACNTSGAWVNGNLNANQAHYFEGDSVAYRLRMSNIPTTGSNTVTMSWDTTKDGAHALDYLTAYGRSEATANPCAGVAGCSGSSTFAIPADARVTAGPDGVPGTADDISQASGVFTLFGGAITGVSAYTLSGTYAGTSSTAITITFTATTATPVLAWGGHISLRGDWKPQLTASNISGSPYHVSFLDLNGKGGNQDRSLQAAAVHTLPTLLVIKHVVNDSGGTATAGDFTLQMTGTGPAPASFPGNENGTLVTFTGEGAYSVGETGPAGYEASYSADCTGTLLLDQDKTCTVTNGDVSRCAGVVCKALDVCHVAGVCDEATGQCSNPAATDGTQCSDGNACTTGDACVAGACVTTGTVSCEAPDQCHELGACNPETGACSAPIAKVDGTPCDDQNACTVDTCQAGVCTGAVVNLVSPTRTAGFFMTHESALLQCLAESPVDLGELHLSTVPQALGLLWAVPLRFPDTGLRAPFDRAALHVLRQALVATCNHRLFGAENDALVTAAVAAVEGTDCTHHLGELELELLLANDSGIEEALPPAFDPGAATASHARSIAEDTTSHLRNPLCTP